MSPAAIGGPHLRTTSINGTGPINNTKKDGVNGIGTLNANGRILPHLDDLVNAKPLVDRQSSLRKLLEAGEEAAKHAETYLDFKRLDLALQQYIIAFTIAVEYIPQSPHFPDLRSRSDYTRLYAGLQKRLNTQHNKFEEVKKIIKEDNTRTGVSPSSLLPYNGQSVPGNTNNIAFKPTISDVNSNSTNKKIEPRQKPMIQPKPQGLHGNSIQTANGISSSLPSSSESDLAARFARLRSPTTTTPTQDPRIRTQQITIPDETKIDQKPINSASQYKQNASILRPLGPREMPMSPATLKTEKPILDMDTSVPMMPRMPDAIYSPARSTDVVSTNSQPPLLSRGSSYFNGKREPSSSVAKVSRNRIVVDDATDYFSSSEVNNYTFDHGHPEPEIRIDKPSILNATTITAEQLHGFLKMGSKTLSVLIVDIRSREEFNEGHIMASSIICIEPIALRKDMSAEDLGEGIVLSPEPEQRLYDQRHTFDLIVYYDQSSMPINTEHIPGEPLNHLQHFSKIIYDHAYDHRLKRRPMLLVGGLDSWIDLFGPNVLKSEMPGNKSLVKNKKHDHQGLGRVSIARRGLVAKRTPRLRTLSAAEEEKWDQALKQNSDDESPAQDSTMDESYYARTTEDFMRRYPELPSIKQSMASPSMPRTLPLYDGSKISAPPTRPPPALPRQRSNGIFEQTPYKNYAMTGGNSSAPSATDPGLCGLRNITGGLCYMNAVAKIAPEAVDDPGSAQLATAYVVWKQYVHATAVGHEGYIGFDQSRIGDHDHRPDTTFGTARQHDANEFLAWLFGVIMDEQNVHRDKTGLLGDVSTFSPKEKSELPRTQNCREGYERALETLNSPLAKLVCNQKMYEIVCQTCKDTSVTSDMLSPIIYLGVDPNGGLNQNLHSLLRTYCLTEERTELDCDGCGVTHSRTKIQRQLFSNLPDYLVFPFKVAQMAGEIRGNRLNVQVNFPLVLDMAEYTWLSQRDGYSDRVLPHQRPPFLYDCYAAVQHSGSTESGHYWALVRRIDPNNRWTDNWHEFNDSRVIPGKTFADTQSYRTVMIFYRRQGAA
ncbi:putative ubiquitin carboxyl-terminal hydrolase protein [Botrytis fragariae]|uniref:Putative ubiquitin carboxyl-terminal hydrolase protein n=1 Tax=Botrytis fragariae TaxID=1964551 RepID=A0A8H6EEH2_9HELO|nr:putative ubiquitin carboxyl-terminal hydrolase protein [Botrytis fragariae]KAF5869163.1 putative ubiquitin carboxyl-terminal hydrolase protein [Botrytis fragariae]